ncbi:transposase-like protein [Rhizobium leguminosarum]
MIGFQSVGRPRAMSRCLRLNDCGITVGMNSPTVSYKNHRFPPQIIARAVWLYFRFPLSLRMVEEMLLERGIVVSHETIRRWGRNSERLMPGSCAEKTIAKGYLAWTRW